MSVAGHVAVQTLGNWNKEIAMPLAQAMGLAQKIYKKDAKGITWLTIWQMSGSASVLTKQSVANRHVGVNGDFTHLLRAGQYKTQRQAGATMSHYFKYGALRLMQPPRDAITLYANVKKRISKIGKVRGLGKRSWKWGFGKGKVMPGVAKLAELQSSDQAVTVGYTLTNKLSYLLKILPGGWEKTVEVQAVKGLLIGAQKSWDRRIAKAIEKVGNK